jgi:hypothetical protein
MSRYPEIITMDQKTVNKLEKEIEKTIADIIIRMGLKKLPVLPSQHTMHMMAKAAVAVYEATADSGDDHGISN